MDYVFSASQQVQTSIANALDSADTQAAQAIYKSIYLRIVKTSKRQFESTF